MSNISLHADNGESSRGAVTKAQVILAVAVLTLMSGAAKAGCTPGEIAKSRALFAQEDQLIERAKAGQCSLVPKLNSLLAVTGAMIRDSMATPGCQASFKTMQPLTKCGCKDVDHLYVCGTAVEGKDPQPSPVRPPQQPDPPE